MRLPIRAPARGPVSHRRSGRGLAVAVLAAWSLVILRSGVFLRYEHAFFDSDQAIFGLMAKHLLEGRAFPLFVYGQSYMLAVDSWIAVPFIAVLGPTVFALHASVVFTNLVVAAVLVVGLVRWSGLGPVCAVAATSFFTFAPPVTAASLVEAAGNIGPLLYVPVLWRLRERPVPFGALLAVGFLHREFTAYVVPVLVLQEVWAGTFWTGTAMRRWLLAATVALATWQGVQALRAVSDPLGPGTRGAVVDEDAGTGTGSIARRIEFVPAELPDRAITMLARHFPGLMGARVVRDPIAREGHDWIVWPFWLGMAGALSGAWLNRSRASRQTIEFPVFLLGVGALAVVGYVVTRPADFFTNRYMLLAIFAPVGATALAFETGAPRWSRAAGLAMALAVATGSAVDHVQLAKRYWGGRERNDLRELADALVSDQVAVAEAGYWRAYKITYLTGERVRVASTDVVRIAEYQKLAAAENGALVRIAESPCPGGVHVASWFLCRRDGSPVVFHAR